MSKSHFSVILALLLVTAANAEFSRPFGMTIWLSFGTTFPKRS